MKKQKRQGLPLPIDESYLLTVKNMMIQTSIGIMPVTPNIMLNNLYTLVSYPGIYDFFGLSGSYRISILDPF